ncbi:MAG: polyprenol monophosphomannose synthase [Candidatus Omnitrophota bacterium]
MFEEGLVSIIIPTYLEADNIQGLLERAISALDAQGSIRYEILVIDDNSSDDTVNIAKRVLEKKGRVIRRIAGIKSLSLSVLDGIKEARGDIIVIMDGDGSHPPELIPLFVKNLKEGYDLVIGSRYIRGGGTRNFPLSRKIISRLACFLGRIVSSVRDNTSGFLGIKRRALEGMVFTSSGFKIGLEIFVKARVNKFKEIPYVFVNRAKGKSKLRTNTIIEYLYQIPVLLKYKFLKNKKCV